jgi:hypothetical protein
MASYEHAKRAGHSPKAVPKERNDMGNLIIQSVTISIELADKEYGNGIGRFLNLKGSYQDGVTLEGVGSVIEDSLDMFLAAWKSLLCSKFAHGCMGGKDLKAKFEDAVAKTEKVKSYLRRVDGQQPGA